MGWQEQLNGDTMAWLPEEGEPGVRYLAMRDLLELPEEDAGLASAQERAHSEGSIATILDAEEAADE